MTKLSAPITNTTQILPKRLPTTIAGAKVLAKAIRLEQAKKNTPISHAFALEITAKALGFSSWNVASARLSNRPRFEPQIGDIVEGLYLKQNFIGKVIGIKTMNGEPPYQVSIHFEKAVDVVSFDSFSAFRQRVTTTLDSEGVCIKHTSDGEPHMVIHRTHSNII